MAVAGVMAFAAASAVAQEEAILSERELEYRSSLSAFESAVDARAASEVRFSRASGELEAARASGDEQRLTSALAQAQAQALELERLDRRVHEAGERLDEARQGYLAALDAQLETLLAELEATTNSGERRRLVALMDDLNNQVREVEGDLDVAQEIRLVAMPETMPDPRDGPLELRLKAQLLERRIEQYDSAMALIDREIGELESRQQRQRSFQQFMAGINRFDDPAVPVLPPAAPGTDPPADQPTEPASDTAAAPGAQEATLDQRIESLQVLRARIENAREQVRIRARLFRNVLGEVTE